MRKTTVYPIAPWCCGRDRVPGINLSYPTPTWLGSGSPAPKPAIAPQHKGQALLVSRPAGVLRQLELLLHRFPAFAGAGGFSHLGRCVLQEREQALDVLLGAETSAGSRMAGDQPLPVHGHHLLQRVLPFERIGADHAAARHRSYRE